MFNTFEGKRKASQKHFAAMAGQAASETTPLMVTPKIEDFASVLSKEPPEWVPVVADKYGLYGWCSYGVREKISHDGGSVRFGWSIWELPKTLLTAEFHAVWVDANNELYDITPKPFDVRRILFIPDKNYGADFDFDQRPLNRRFRLYEEPDLQEEVRSRIGSLRPAQLKYETNRAVAAGMSLEEWILRKMGSDNSIAKTVDAFIEVCDLYDKKLEQLHPGAGYVVPDTELIQLGERRNSLNNKVLRISRELARSSLQ